MKKVLKNVCVVGVASVFIIQSTSMAYASWGLARFNQQPQASAPAQPAVTSRQQVAPSAPSSNQSSNNSSTTDYILSLRNQAATTTPTATASNTPSTNTNNTSTVSTSNQTNTAALEAEMLTLINNERKSKGLKPLQRHSSLAGVAKQKSNDMVAKNYFAHNSPTYGNFYEMVRNAGITYSQVGENLAKARDVKKAHIMLMGSEGHRNNILSSNFTHIGIGITYDTNGIVITQLFIK